MSRDVYSVITSPLVTEKATLVNGAGNQVVFRVRPNANKSAIKTAVETLFKVKVEKVRTIQYLGKERRVGKSVGRKSAWKKAYVTLAEGDRIDFFEGA
ncbi:MAG: 50S ribosomal protein L23 [Deltaproteobacteria bacterium]|nr:50S ribosomal protein L23 [Deltaproteobacteria bacterium]